MKKYTKEQLLNAPLMHNSHKRPTSRRDFISQGFMTGAATIAAPSIFGLFANPRMAHATLSQDIQDMKDKLNRLKTPKGFAPVPVLCHLNGVSPTVETSGYFYRIVDMIDLLG